MPIIATTITTTDDFIDTNEKITNDNENDVINTNNCDCPNNHSLMVNNRLEIRDNVHDQSSSSLSNDNDSTSSSDDNDSCKVHMTTTTCTETKLIKESIQKKPIDCDYDLDYVVHRETKKIDSAVKSIKLFHAAINKEKEIIYKKTNHAKDNAFISIDEDSIQNFFLRKIKNYVERYTHIAHQKLSWPNENVKYNYHFFPYYSTKLHLIKKVNTLIHHIVGWKKITYYH